MNDHDEYFPISRESERGLSQSSDPRLEWEHLRRFLDPFGYYKPRRATASVSEEMMDKTPDEKFNFKIDGDGSWPLPTSYVQTWYDFLNMSLSSLWEHIENQVDWYNSPALSTTNDPDGKRQETIRQILFSLNSLLGQMHKILVKDLIAAVNGKKTEELDANAVFLNDPEPIFKAFQEAHTQTTSFYIPRSVDATLSAKSKFDYFNKVFAGNGVILNLLTDYSLDAFKSNSDIDDLNVYVNSIQKPVFETTNDLTAFGKVNNTTGTSIPDYQKKLNGRIRNIHRFHAEVLDQQVINYARVGLAESDRDRLVVLLHATHDHNGVTVLDDGTKELALTHNDPLEKDPSKRLMVLIVDGREKVEDYKGVFADLAKTYGRWGRIDQFVIHGHGHDTGINIGKQAINYVNEGRIDAAGDLSFTQNYNATKALFDEVFNAMKVNANVPKEELQWKSEVVFASCLTNSNDIPSDIRSSDGTKAQKKLNKWLSENKNFVSRVSAMITPTGGKFEDNLQNINSIIGSNAVTTNRQWIIDEQNKLGLYSDKFAPKLAGTKLEYVEFGREQESVFTALLSEWAKIDLIKFSESDLYKAVYRRSQADATFESTASIHNAYGVLISPPENFTDLKLIQQIRAFDAYSSTSEVRNVSNTKGLELLRTSKIISQAHFDQYMYGYKTTSLWTENNYGRAVRTHMVLARNTPEVEIPALIDFLSTTSFDLSAIIGIQQSAECTLDPNYLEEAGVYTKEKYIIDNKVKGQVILAVTGLIASKKKVVDLCKSFLSPMIVGNDLSPELQAMLSDAHTRNFVRTFFGLTDTIEKVKPINDGNLANLPIQKGDANNSLRATPKYITIYGKNTSIYAQPDEKSTEIGKLADKTAIFTQAEYKDWYVINWPSFGTGFVKQSMVTLTK
ncbi:MAG: hypothetical protein ACRCYO_06240 [Bacteroidia bacterium]